MPYDTGKRGPFFSAVTILQKSEYIGREGTAQQANPNHGLHGADNAASTIAREERPMANAANVIDFFPQ